MPFPGSSSMPISEPIITIPTPLYRCGDGDDNKEGDAGGSISTYAFSDECDDVVNLKNLLILFRP